MPDTFNLSECLLYSVLTEINQDFHCVYHKKIIMLHLVSSYHIFQNLYSII